MRSNIVKSAQSITGWNYFLNDHIAPRRVVRTTISNDKQHKAFEIPKSTQEFFDVLKNGIDPVRYPKGAWSYLDTYTEDTPAVKQYFDRKPSVVGFYSKTNPAGEHKHRISVRKDSLSGDDATTLDHEVAHFYNNNYGKLSEEAVAKLEKAYSHQTPVIHSNYPEIARDKQLQRKYTLDEFNSINTEHQKHNVKRMRVGKMPDVKTWRDFMDSRSYLQLYSMLKGNRVGYYSKVPEELSYWEDLYELPRLKEREKEEKDWYDEAKWPEKSRTYSDRKRRIDVENRIKSYTKEDIERAKEILEAYRWVQKFVRNKKRPATTASTSVHV